MSELVFVTGGARSGKSRFALEWAASLGGDAVSFIATAEALDAEMAARIAAHRQERNPRWQVIEEPWQLERALQGCQHRVVLLDCLSLWVSNGLLRGHTEADMKIALESLLAARDQSLIVVSNEVGFGIVPENALARAYRDVLGRINQMVAAASSEAYLLVSGLPLRLK